MAKVAQHLPVCVLREPPPGRTVSSGRSGIRGSPQAPLYTFQRSIPSQPAVESPGVFAQVGIPSPKSSPVHHADGTQEVCILSRASDHCDPRQTAAVDGILLTYFVSSAFFFLLLLRP